MDLSLSGAVEYTADFLAGSAGGYVGTLIAGEMGGAIGLVAAQKYVKEGAFLIYYGTTNPYPTQSPLVQSPINVEQQIDNLLVDEYNKNHDGSYISYLIASL